MRFLRYRAAVEQRLRDSGMDYTMLQPNLYFRGLLAMAGAVRQYGSSVAPIGDAQVSAVDVRDIAAVAAVALTESRHAGKSYPITGSAAVTHTEITAALSATTGRSIIFQDVPAADFGAMLHGALPRGRWADCLHTRSWRSATLERDESAPGEDVFSQRAFS